MTTHTTIATLRFGSHLYGTTTPDSDVDFKSVHIPAPRTILLGQREDVIQLGTKANAVNGESGFWSGRTRANTREDTDHESYALHKLFAMLRVGDMNAIELLFAPPEHVLQSSLAWDLITSTAVRARLLDRRCEGFVGYCQDQAIRYGIRASRIETVKAALDALNRAASHHPEGFKSRLYESSHILEDLAGRFDDIKIVSRASGHSDALDHLEICGRLTPYTSFLAVARDLCLGLLKRYGKRSVKAAANNGYDFPAMSHAVRAAREAIELLSTGHIAFPRPDAAELVAIKTGQVPGATVSALIDSLLTQVEEAARQSVLPETVDEALMDDLQVELYGQQIRSAA